MKIIDTILYIEFTEMVKAGVSDNTLKWAKSNHSYCWKFIKDPQDKRKVLIEYEALKDQYKEMLEKAFGNPYECVRQEAIKSYLRRDDQAFKYYSNKVMGNGEVLPIAYIKKYQCQAEWLNLTPTAELMKALGCKTKAEYYDVFIKQASLAGVGLPTSYSKLMAKLRQYAGGSTKNYDCLVSGKFDNKNTEKICESAGEWLLAKYALPIKLNVEALYAMYNKKAVEQGWKPLKDSRTIYGYLHNPEIKGLWYGARHGQRKYGNDKYQFPIMSEKPSYRDAMWVTDGTKLNYFDQQNRLKASYQVYMVMDVYSEVFLGMHISPTENYEAQYYAFKQAVEFSKNKPYQIKYDNQGGHGKISKFIDQLCTVHNPARPYRAKAKTIESAFGRFQMQFMSNEWFYTGQNITAKSLNSKANMEFVIKNQKYLPDIEMIKRVYQEKVDAWHAAPHHKTGKPRLQMYLESQNPNPVPVDYLDMVELFWLTNNREITYLNGGIKMVRGGNEYHYEVLKNGMPDMNFRLKYIDQAFTVKFDPDNMDHIRLYRNTASGLRFVDMAETRIKVPYAMVDRKEGDGALIAALLKFGDDEIALRESRLQSAQDKHNISAEDLIESLGGHMKNESNMDAFEIEEESNGLPWPFNLA